MLIREKKATGGRVTDGWIDGLSLFSKNRALTCMHSLETETGKGTEAESVMMDADQGGETETETEV